METRQYTSFGQPNNLWEYFSAWVLVSHCRFDVSPVDYPDPDPACGINVRLGFLFFMLGSKSF